MQWARIIGSVQNSFPTLCFFFITDCIIYRQVHQRSCQIVKQLLLKTTSPIQVAQYLSQVSEVDSEKIRLAAMKVLMELMEVYCQEMELLAQVVKK